MSLTITANLKKHLTDKLGLAGDANDAAALAHTEKCLKDGTLSFKDYSDLTEAPDAAVENRVKSLVNDAVGVALGNFKSELLGEVKNLFIGGSAAAAVANPPAGGAATLPAGQVPADPRKAFGFSAANPPAGGDGASTLSGYDAPRVKSVIERFTDNRTTATYDKSGNAAIVKMFGGQPVQAPSGSGMYTLDMPTERSKAIVGAWFKLLVNRDCRSTGRSVPWQFKMNEQDMALCQYAAHECRFVGPVGYRGGENADHWFDGEKAISDLHIKTLLDDSTSGGLEAVPIEFDAAVILTPLLQGELFPYVNITNVSRRRIEAAAIGNPTVSWGTAEGTAIGLFNTDSFISAFDNNIYPVTGAMELGRDFLSDSPLNIGGIIQQNYGNIFRQEMDNVVATGDGTSQPEGLFTASGVTTVTPGGGAGATPEVGDYEGLMFTVAKEYMQEAGMPLASRAMFIGTQTSYQRARGIPVDGSADERRIFGMNQMDYRLFDFRYAINESLTNAQIGFFCMNRYRMYRRQGLEVQVVRGDVHSVRTNTETVVVRARFGGALEQAAAGAKIVAAQA